MSLNWGLLVKRNQANKQVQNINKKYHAEFKINLSLSIFINRKYKIDDIKMFMNFHVVEVVIGSVIIPKKCAIIKKVLLVHAAQRSDLSEKGRI